MYLGHPDVGVGVMANDPLRGCPTCGTPVAGLSLGLRDYRWVSEALPGREAPMDLDCVLEKAGHVLIMENKPLGMPLPLGQRLTLKTFVRLGCDVWVVWEDEDGTHAEVGSMDRNGNINFVERMTINKLRRRVTAWRDQAAEDYQ
jgi:hypothetical protein